MNVLELLKKRLNFSRVLFYALAVTVTFVLLGGIFYINGQENKSISVVNKKTEDSQKIIDAIRLYQNISAQIEEAKKTYPQIDLKAEDALLVEIISYIHSGDYENANKLIAQLIDQLAKKIADEKLKGILTGKAAYSSTESLVVKIFQGETQSAEIQSLANTVFTYWLPAGKYILKANSTGYNEYSKEFEIKTGETTDLQFELTKTKAKTAASAPAPAPQPAASVNDGVYSRETVNTDRGSFTVNLLRVDLNQYEMRVDTAADGDCENNCPVMSLSSYVARNNAFAGIHGTYFCPTSYSSCIGKTNSFYYKMFNTRLGIKINWSNGLGDYLPFLSIDSGGSPHYYDTWFSAKDSDMKTGISCRPHLVENGQIVLADGDMDSDKERYSKISHGFIGLKGQVIYAGIVSSANLPDSAAVVKALGIENAFNIDGGGTSAMFYNGSYKVGPGRDMPNAIVFVRR